MLKRNLQAKITNLLNQFPAVVILGARQVGKTTLAKQVAPDWRYLDMEQPDDFESIYRDPAFFFQQFSNHLIIDEAQEYPELFAILRGVIDKDRDKKGRFILTGSSSPDILSSVAESLAGRVAIVELGTLKANEIYQQPLSEFYQIFTDKLNIDRLPKSAGPLSSAQIQKAWLRGGYPEPILNLDKQFYNVWMENYRDTYINRDIAKLFPRLNKINYQRFMQMLCQVSGSILTKSELARAIEVSEKTISEYIKIASGTFLWQPLLSYEKNITKSVIKMPKGFIRDSGLLHYLLKIGDYDDLYFHPKAGNSFEGFVIEEICKGLQALPITNWDMHYYRTRGQAEIDLILQGFFGILPIEIKQGVKVKSSQLASLSGFIEEQGLDFGLVINQATEAMWLAPKIYQLPVTWL
jgi:predicted AAA+ superfamily ATPase